MEDKKLKDKIENNAKKLGIDPRNKGLLLKGKELEESLIYLNKDNIRFMLTREIELLKASLKYSKRRESFTKKLFVIIVIATLIGLIYYKKDMFLNNINNLSNKEEKIFKDKPTSEKIVKTSPPKVENKKEIEKVEKEEVKTISNNTAVENNLTTKHIANLSNIMNEEQD